MSGSVYGQGPYGVGRYSRKLTQTGIVHLQTPTRVQLTGTTPLSNGTVIIEGMTRVRMTGALTFSQRLGIEAVGSVTIGGERMWSAIPVAPCQPWMFLTQCQCGSALPNPIGAMFPSAATPP